MATNQKATNGKEQGVAVREPRTAVDIDRFFDRAMRGLWPRHHFWSMPSVSRESLWRESSWLPEMDVFDKDGKTVIRLDLPGLKRDDIDVAVEGDMLVIRGRRQEEKEVKEKDYYCAERATGEFTRTITLPEDVETKSVDATYKEGVLEVVIPKPAGTKNPASTKVQVR